MTASAVAAGLPGCALALAAGVSALLIVVLRPLLQRYALARPNARSLHRLPTPQGGGIAVLAGAAAAALVGAVFAGTAQWNAPMSGLGLVLGASLVMALVGLVDDLRPLPPLPRLGLQLLCVAAVVAALPEGGRVLPWLPLWAEGTLLVLGGAWFVNLVNFMDGMDWLSVVEMLPLTLVLAGLWGFGLVSAPAGLLSLGLCGGLAGFAPFNRPVARLFLGDVGSLPIGLIVAFGLFDLAAHGGLAAAILLPLYYIADSGLTLLWRLRRGEPVWQAHRQHFYQVAVARGLSVPAVLARIFACNMVLAALALASLWAGDGRVCVLLLALGCGGVAVLLRGLAAGRVAAV